MMSLDEFLAICWSDDPRKGHAASESLRQEFVGAKAWDEFVSFFEGVLFRTHPVERARRVIDAWDPQFQEMIDGVIAASLVACREHECCAIYVELETSSRSLDFYVCRKYDVEDIDWACKPLVRFRGPKIRFMFPRWLQSSIPFEKAVAAGHPEAVRLKAAMEKRQNSAAIAAIQSIGAYDEEAVMDYFFAQILATLGISWEQLGSPSIHLACAEHDHPIIHFQ